MKAKLGVKTLAKGGTATLLWKRQRSSHTIELYGPFGGGRIKIAQNQQGAKLRDSKKREFVAATAEQLLYNRLGWKVPFESLQFWVLGVPSSNVPTDLRIDQDGHLEYLVQDGWEIHFNDYRDYRNLVLPRRLVMKALPGTVRLVDKRGRDAGEVLEVKYVLKHWLKVHAGRIE